MFIVLCNDISLVLRTLEISLHKTIHMISKEDPPFTCSCYNISCFNLCNKDIRIWVWPGDFHLIPLNINKFLPKAISFLPFSKLIWESNNTVCCLLVCYGWLTSRNFTPDQTLWSYRCSRISVWDTLRLPRKNYWKSEYILWIASGLHPYPENLENLEFCLLLFQAWIMHGICSKSGENQEF